MTTLSMKRTAPNRLTFTRTSDLAGFGIAGFGILASFLVSFAAEVRVSQVWLWSRGQS